MDFDLLLERRTVLSDGELGRSSVSALPSFESALMSRIGTVFSPCPGEGLCLGSDLQQLLVSCLVERLMTLSGSYAERYTGQFDSTGGKVRGEGKITARTIR